MAIHDEERRTGYMDDARRRYDGGGAGTTWAGILVGLALVAFIGYMLFAAAGPRTGEGVRQTPQSPQTTTTPRTTTPAPTAPTTQPQ
jgi:hypothetical protein